MRSLPAFCGLVTVILVLLPEATPAQWVQSSPDLDASAFAASGEFLMAGTHAKGIFLSLADGDAWLAIDSGLPRDPSLPSVIETVNDMVLGSDNVYAAIHGAGIFHLSEDASHWVAANSGLPVSQYGNTFVYTLGSDGTHLFAGTDDGGVYRSADGGFSWTPADDGLPVTPYAHVRAFAVSGGNLFAGTDSSVYRTANNGTSWIEADAGLPAKGYQYVRCLASNDGYVFAGCGGSAYGVYRSSDNGASWSKADSGLPASVTVTALTASGANLFAGTEYDGVFVSSNNGARWTALDAGLPQAAALTGVSALAVCGANLFAGLILYIKNDKTGNLDEFRSIWRLPISTATLASPRMPKGPMLDLQVKTLADRRTAATFCLPQALPVRLDLYDLSGRCVVSLVNETLRAGEHTVECPTRGLGGGCYLLRLAAGGQTRTGQVRLIR